MSLRWKLPVQLIKEKQNTFAITFLAFTVGVQSCHPGLALIVDNLSLCKLKASVLWDLKKKEKRNKEKKDKPLIANLHHAIKKERKSILKTPTQIVIWQCFQGIWQKGRRKKNAMKYLKSYFCQEYVRGERWGWKGCTICKPKPESTTFCIGARDALGPSQSCPENMYQALIQQGLAWQSQGCA